MTKNQHSKFIIFHFPLFSSFFIFFLIFFLQTFSTALKSTSLFSKDFINGNHKQADDNANIYEKDKFSGTLVFFFYYQKEK